MSTPPSYGNGPGHTPGRGEGQHPGPGQQVPQAPGYQAPQGWPTASAPSGNGGSPPPKRAIPKALIVGCCAIITLTVLGVVASGLWWFFQSNSPDAQSCTSDDQSTSESAESECEEESTPAEASGSDSPGSDSDTSTGTQALEGERISMDIPARWEKQDITNQDFVYGSDFYNHETNLWEWYENDSDPMPREKMVYAFYGESQEPSTTKIDPKLVEEHFEPQVDQYKAMSTKELTSHLSGAGHGCTSNAAYMDQPKLVQRDKLTGLEFTFECVGSSTGQLGLKGIYGSYVDEFGDRHVIMMTTDANNYEAHASEFESILATIKQK